MTIFTAPYAGKYGKWTLRQVQDAANEGFARLQPYLEKCPFPDKPDEAAVERLVVDTLVEGVKIPATFR